MNFEKIGAVITCFETGTIFKPVHVLPYTCETKQENVY